MPARTWGKCSRTLRQLQAENKRLRALLEALVDKGPYLDDRSRECLNCGKGPYDEHFRYIGWFNQKHASECAWRKARKALDEYEYEAGIPGIESREVIDTPTK